MFGLLDVLSDDLLPGAKLLAALSSMKGAATIGRLPASHTGKGTLVASSLGQYTIEPPGRTLAELSTCHSGWNGLSVSASALCAVEPPRKEISGAVNTAC